MYEYMYTRLYMNNMNPVFLCFQNKELVYIHNALQKEKPYPEKVCPPNPHSKTASPHTLPVSRRNSVAL